MPFALIAVTLLLLGSVYGVIYVSIENAEDDTKNIGREILALDDAVVATELDIETRLGGILGEISRGSGTLAERCAAFDSMTADLIDSYPRIDRGVHVTVLDSSIGLRVEKLRVSDDPGAGSAPSFLRATGYVDARFDSGSGTAEKRMEIDADGTSGLPLLIESGSSFQLSLEGDESALTQLMSYQLTSLAQSRVLSGYGAMNAFGRTGTSSIITEEDVTRAYRISVSMIESMCFRDTGDGNTLIESSERFDPADHICGGYVDIDLCQIFAQTLISMLDALIFQWMQYFMLTDVSDILDTVNDVVKKGWNAIVSFFNGTTESDTVRGHLRGVMANQGLTENDYRWLMRGEQYVLSVPEGSFQVTAGSATETVHIPEMQIPIPYPESDVVSWAGWNSFMDEYRGDRNEIRELLKGFVKSMALDLAGMSGLGVVRVSCDPTDDMTFAQTLETAIVSAMDGGSGMLAGSLERTVRSGEVVDPLYAAMYEKIRSQAGPLFRKGDINENIQSTLRSGIDSYLAANHGGTLDPGLVDRIIATCDTAGAERDMNARMSAAIDARLSLFEDTLGNIAKDSGSVIREIMSAITEKGMSVIDILPHVRNRMLDVYEQSAENMSLSPGSGITDLPGHGPFLLHDGDQNTFSENITVEDWGRISVEILQPKDNPGGCIHYVGFGKHSAASYSASFVVSLNGVLNYRASSSSDLSSALGISDGEFSGSVDLSTKMEIVCVSGWPLAGVDYRSSNTFISDAWAAILELAEPLMGPLKEFYSAIKEIASACGRAILEISRMMTELVQKLYDALMPVVDAFNELASKCSDVLAEVCVSVVDVGIANQTVKLELFGLTLTLKTQLATLVKNTKNILSITLSKENGDTGFSATMNLKKTGEEYSFVCNGFAYGKDWRVEASADPFMKGDRLLGINGHVRGVEFSASVPELVQYRQIETRLSDMPGIGTLISNIPVPLPGYKGSFDLGLCLKYDLPLKRALVINEFESNPPGDDSGNEWVELYNASGKTVDLEGYSLYPGSGELKGKVLSGMALPPGGRTVIGFDRQALNNSKSSFSNGDCVILADRNGNIIDRTPCKTDQDNSEFTWQRSVDAATVWSYMKGSPGTKNGGMIPGGLLMKVFVLECIKNAAEKAFFEMGNKIKSVDDVAEYLERVMELAINDLISSIAGTIVDAYFFIELELTDMAETQHYGLEVAIGTGPEMVEEAIRWLIGQIGVMTKYVGNPAGIDPVDIITDGVYIRTTVYAGISAPKFLNAGEEKQVEVGVSVSVNLSAVCTILGMERGTWKAEIGVVLRDLPSEMVPPALNADKDKMSDLWLFKAEFSRYDPS